jgi:amino acid adenylation domain-containing protein
VNRPSAMPEMSDAAGKRALLARLLHERGGRGRIYPLSFSQQRIWFLDRLMPDSPFYNQYLAFRLSPPPDPRLFEQALQAMVRRHDTLRTTFTVVDGQPRQVVAPEGTAVLPVEDLSSWPAAMREAEALRRAQEEARQPFDLEQGPLMRTRLLRLSDVESVFLLTLHHIISDGWSLTVFFRELSALGDALADGRTPALAPLTIQYPDFALWQRQTFDGEALTPHLRYWNEHLAAAPLLALPTDHPRPAVASFRGGWVGRTLSVRLSDALRTLSQREGATLFMTLLTAFKILLSRYSGQSDLVVGVPVANRNRAELEPLIGFFINTLVMRTDLSRNPTFREALRRVKEVALGAFSHQDMPFEKLVEVLHPQRDISRNPMFQVTFQLFSQPGIERHRLDPSAPALAVDTGTSLFDLAASVYDQATGLNVQFDYSSDLFEAETIRRWLDNFLVLLEAVVADPDQTITRLPLLTPAERHRLLVEFNDTVTEFPRDRPTDALVEDWAERTPDAVAVFHHQATCTYRELSSRATQVSRLLCQRGVLPGAAVAVCLERGIDWIIAMLGVWKAGAAYVPLDPALPAQRLAALRQESGTSLCVTPDLLREACCAPGFEFAAPTPEPERLAYIIHTSGSTGQPKGVEVSHRSLLNLIHWHRREYGLTPVDRTTQLAGVSFDAAVWEIWPALASGASITIYDRELTLAPVALLERLATDGITLCFLPTPLAEQVLREPWPPGVRLRALLTGGDTLHGYPPAGLPCRVVNHYGPTECTVLTTAADVPPAGDAQGLPPIGRPMANTRLFVLDAAGELVPLGAPGELWIAGELVARGYRGRPDWTSERFVPCPFDPAAGRAYRTGDRVSYRADGQLLFLGRLDRQVKVRGFRIEPGEVEAAFLSHPAVREAVVLSCEVATGDRELVAFVTRRDEIEAEELRRHVASRLPDYMVPTKLFLVDDMPLNPSGKIDRAALLERQLRAAVAAPKLVPRNALEREIAGIWEELLGLTGLGVDQNFFEVGGHSLLLVKLQGRLREQLGRTIGIMDLFRYPTVASLAEALASQRAGGGAVRAAASRAERSRRPANGVPPQTP